MEENNFTGATNAPCHIHLSATNPLSSIRDFKGTKAFECQTAARPLLHNELLTKEFVKH